LGNREVFEFDALDRLTRVIDPLGQATASVFDANGNQTQVKDAKGNVHRFDFDGRDAVISDTNPLNLSEAYLYDAKHNLVQKTDRKGQVTRYTYDALNRLTTITYADSSTIDVTYDSANRPTTYVDSMNGTIELTYDNRDRVTQVATPKGFVNYTYFANGLRQSMRVPTQPPLTYTYDPGNRLIRIDQPEAGVTQSVVFGYDAADRRVSATYTNGTQRVDTYDAAGQLTKITYKKADGSLLGDLGYTYDAAGRRSSVTGSLARTALPAELSSATVDAANRLTTAGAATLAYDANGNLLSDGSQQYVWNARDQLIQITNSSGHGIASFRYDAFGRREVKLVNGVGTGYVYDGLNVLQELSIPYGFNNIDQRSIKGTYIAGGIDEIFARRPGLFAGGRAQTYLTDALGSTVRLVDSTGSTAADYTYEPYGKTTSVSTVDNPVQYTGREADATGLYYYRARYYSPALGRFISSDPIGLDGGINTYVYVGGNPVSITDPSGRIPIPIFLVTGAIGGVAGFVGNVGYQLYHNGGHPGCVKWGNAGIAFMSGAVAGALLPITGRTAIGAALTGAVTNAGGYYATQMYNGEAVTGAGIATSAFFGGVGGAIGGKLANPYWFAKRLSPWVSDPAVIAANTDALTLGRVVAGAGMGNVDPLASPESGCECR
jgi:RHS repeat-associated protein